MSSVDFKAVGDHAAELTGYARDSSLAECLKTLQEIAAAGQLKYPHKGERFEVAKLRAAAYDLQRMAVEFETVADSLIAMVGELPDAEPAADNESETDGMTDEEKREAYKSAAKDGVVATDHGLVAAVMHLPSYRGERQGEQPTQLRAPTWLDKMLGRK